MLCTSGEGSTAWQSAQWSKSTAIAIQRSKRQRMGWGPTFPFRGTPPNTQAWHTRPHLLKVPPHLTLKTKLSPHGSLGDTHINHHTWSFLKGKTTAISDQQNKATTDTWALLRKSLTTVFLKVMSFSPRWMSLDPEGIGDDGGDGVGLLFHSNHRLFHFPYVDILL